MNKKLKELGRNIEKEVIKNKYQSEEIALFLEVIENLKDSNYVGPVEDINLELYKVQNNNSVSAIYYSKKDSSLAIETYFPTGLIELQSIVLDKNQVTYEKALIDTSYEEDKELSSYKVEIANKRPIYEYSFIDGEEHYKREKNGTILVNGQITNIPSTVLVELKEKVDTKIEALKTTTPKTYEI